MYILMLQVTMAQVPQKMSYQALIRDNTNNLVINQPIGILISILQGNVTGNMAYAETHNPTTDANGIINIEIGGGLIVSGNFGSINWGNGPYFLKTEIDINGGSNYTIAGTKELISVPYALFAGNGIGGVSSTGNMLQLTNGGSFFVPGISEANFPTPIPTVCNLPNAFNDTLVYDSLSDAEGNVYKTIVINNKEWMAENLRTKKYSNGDNIPYVTQDLTWNGLNTGAYCYYNNDSLNECPYGMLYNGYAVTDSRNVCPIGWHVPTMNERDSLIDYLASNGAPGLPGTQLKSKGTFYWTAPNGGNNAVGFSALPAGYRAFSGEYFQLTLKAFFWTSTSYTSTHAYEFDLTNTGGSVSDSVGKKLLGYSVRCIKD
jgi:uncharacterized protein (TIGR02145 family)